MPLSKQEPCTACLGLTVLFPLGMWLRLFASSARFQEQLLGNRAWQVFAQIPACSL